MVQLTHGNLGTRGHYGVKMGQFAIYPPKFLKLDHFQPSMNQMTPTMTYIIVTQEQFFFWKISKKIFFQGSPLWMKKQKLWISIFIIDLLVQLSSYFVVCYNYAAHIGYYFSRRIESKVSFGIKISWAIQWLWKVPLYVL